mmetsp:Transcript_20775/g.48210  ORF Transcript_20775/g.48210 Transcript_20775/m.48210 type:complete len:221 (+) Transcript_20775:111-773(+)
MGNSACCEGNGDKGMTTVSTYRTGNAFDEENVASMEPVAQAEAKEDTSMRSPPPPQVDFDPPQQRKADWTEQSPPAPAPEPTASATMQPVKEPPAPQPVVIEQEEKKQTEPAPAPPAAVVPSNDLPREDTGPAEFRVTLERAGKKLGMVVFNKRNEDFVRVRNVKDDGFIAEWNAKNPTKQIKDGYHILEVNGETSPERMRDIIGDSKLPTCSFLIRKPQ